MIFLAHQHYFDYSKGQNLSQIEHEILAFLLSDSQNEQSCSIRVVAKELTTSTATIIRLCKKLGFSGYTAFTEKLRQEHTDLYPTEATQLLSATLTKKSAVFINQYQDTLDALAIADVTAFTQLLTTKQVIQIIGDDSDEFITYIASRLQLRGFRVLASSNKDTLLNFEKKLSDTTLIIVFSKNQVPELILKKMNQAKLKKMPIIGFYGENKLINFRQWFDVQFKISSLDTEKKGNYESTVIMILDLLLSLIPDTPESEL